MDRHLQHARGIWAGKDELAADKPAASRKP